MRDPQSVDLQAPLGSRPVHSSSSTFDRNPTRFESSADGGPQPIAIVSTQQHVSLGDADNIHTSFESALSLESLDDRNDKAYNSSASTSLLLDSVDGPLHELRPSFTSLLSSSRSSAESDLAISPNSPQVAKLDFGLSTSPRSLEGTGTSPPFARRVVSAPQVVIGSPRSPLANETNPSGYSYLTQRRRSAQYQSSGATFASSASNYSALHPSPQSSRRRRSSVSLSTSLGAGSSSVGGYLPTVPHGSFVGSFEQSLLTGRLSALPSLPLPYLASLGVLGGADAPARLRCPPHLNLPFEAFFYSGPDGAKSSSPYVGTIDLEAHYYSLLRAASSPTPAATSTSTSTSDAATALPRFPGYRVPARGQIQLVIKNPNSTAIKLFLIPYDLTGLDRQRQGGKTFVRQKSYAFEVTDASNSKGRLRYAIHLQFCSPPLVRTSSTKGSKATEPQYYLHGNIRVVFATRALDLSEKLRVVSEGPSGEGKMTYLDYAAYAGPGTEWDMARKKAKERGKLREEEIESDRFRTRSEPGLIYPMSIDERRNDFEDHDGLMSAPPTLMPAIVDDPDGMAFDLAQSRTTTPPPFEGFFSNNNNDDNNNNAAAAAAAPTQPLANFLHQSTRGPLAKSNLSISFVRAVSPIPGTIGTMGRSPSRSGLSTSRPMSRVNSGILDPVRLEVREPTLSLWDSSL